MPRRPQRSLSYSFSFASVTALALLFLCPVVAHIVDSRPEFFPVIGIDLGTSYSCVGIQQGGRVEIIANDQGSRKTPSWVSISDEGLLVGDAAKSAFLSNPSNTVFDAKRLIGRGFGEAGVQRHVKHWPFKVLDKRGEPSIQVKHRGDLRDFTPEEISAMVLGKMKEIAEAYIGENVTYAVVAVPPYFNPAQRQATRDAGEIAGLQIISLIHEPTAAAIAYGLDKKGGERQIIVYDLGGGTFDVTLLSIEGGVFEVLATAGDAHLGGEDFNKRVIDHFIKLYKTKNGTDVSTNLRAMGKLKREVEKAKRTLSSQASTKLEIESFEGGNDFSETLTRAKFEELNMDLFRKTMKPVEQVFEIADVKKEDINDIVLVGGSTRIPKVQELLKEFFGGKELSTSINPDEVVAYGAAIQGHVIAGEKTCFLPIDTCPLTLGIETTGGVFTKFILRSTILPAKGSQIFSTAADNQTTVLIQIYEGERSMTKDNNLLGKFELTGIPPAPRGVPQTEVTFEVDANGTMKVAAVDKGTGKSQQITIENTKGRLTQEEIERVILEAEEFAAEDEAQLKRIEALGSAYARLQLDEGDKKIILATMKEPGDWIGADGQTASADELEGKLSEVQSVVNPITSKLRGSGTESYSPGEDDEDFDRRHSHDEL